MTLLLARFDSPETTLAAAEALRRRDIAIIDAYTPFPVEGIAGYLPRSDRGVRAIMLGTGFFVAACCYLLEWWSAVIAYPFNSGGRPLHSWPVFVLFPFEFGVLSAAIAGLVTFFVKTRLPRYHDMIFESDLHREAGEEGFLLSLTRPERESDQEAVLALLRESGATAVQELGT